MSRRIQEFNDYEKVVITKNLNNVSKKYLITAPLVIVELNYFDQKRYKIKKNRFGPKGTLLNENEVSYFLSNYEHLLTA